jgi:hypothetical protein
MRYEPGWLRGNTPRVLTNAMPQQNYCGSAVEKSVFNGEPMVLEKE